MSTISTLFNIVTSLAVLQVACGWFASPVLLPVAFGSIFAALCLIELVSALNMIRSGVKFGHFLSLRGLQRATLRSDWVHLFNYCRIVLFDFTVLWWILRDASGYPALSMIVVRVLASLCHIHSPSMLLAYLYLSRGI